MSGELWDECSTFINVSKWVKHAVDCGVDEMLMLCITGSENERGLWFDGSKALVNHTVRTVFQLLLARARGDRQTSDSESVSYVQVC